MREPTAMTYRYTDPSGSTAEQVITWEVEQGYQGRWSRCKVFDERSDAIGWVEKRRLNCPMENLRVVQVETTTVRTVEP